MKVYLQNAFKYFSNPGPTVKILLPLQIVYSAVNFSWPQQACNLLVVKYSPNQSISVLAGTSMIIELNKGVDHKSYSVPQENMWVYMSVCRYKIWDDFKNMYQSYYISYIWRKASCFPLPFQYVPSGWECLAVKWGKATSVLVRSLSKITPLGEVTI